MFIVNITYKKPIEMIEKHLQEHRLFLDNCYSNNSLIASGPKNPRNGGILISQLSDLSQLEKLLNKDPFMINGLADYEIIEFIPTKSRKEFSLFC